MTNKKDEHPYADILRAIADGKSIQVRYEDGEWLDASGDDGIYYVLNMRKLRIKPSTIRIGDCDVPEPVRHKLDYGVRYFVTDPADEELACQSFWGDDETDLMWLERGFIHLNKESAIIHAKALISLTEEK